MVVTLGRASSRRVAGAAQRAPSPRSARRRPRVSCRQTFPKLSNRPGLAGVALVCPSKMSREEGYFLRRRLARLKRVVGRSNAHITPGSDARVMECMLTTAAPPYPTGTSLGGPIRSLESSSNDQTATDCDSPRYAQGHKPG